MSKVCYRWIWFAEAKFDEHVLVIALILFCRMHAATREVIRVLPIILHRSHIYVATGTSVDIVMIAYCTIPH